MELGFDVSNYTGRFDKAEAREIADMGYKFMVTSTHQPDVFWHQADAALAAGLRVEAYVYLYFDDERMVQHMVRQALTTIAPYPGRLWLDVEGETYMPQAAAISALNKAIYMCRSEQRAVGVYTNKPAWEKIMGLTDIAHDLPVWLPLWWASWDNDPSIGQFLPFGGWTRPDIKQYAADVRLGRLQPVDLDVRYIW